MIVFWNLNVFQGTDQHWLPGAWSRLDVQMGLPFRVNKIHYSRAIEGILENIISKSVQKYTNIQLKVVFSSSIKLQLNLQLSEVRRPSLGATWPWLGAICGASSTWPTPWTSAWAQRRTQRPWQQILLKMGRSLDKGNLNHNSYIYVINNLCPWDTKKMFFLFLIMGTDSSGYITQIPCLNI